MAAPKFINELSAGSLSAAGAVAVVLRAGDTVQVPASSFITQAASFAQSGTGATSRTPQDKLREFISVADFGAVGDNSTDDTTAIQNAINAAISQKKNLLIPYGSNGSYKISSPLIIANRTGINYDYVSLAIVGQSGPMGDGFNVRLMPTFVDTFVFGIQGARSVRIENIAMEGPNPYTMSSDYHEVFSASTAFVGSGYRDSRYSPYSGIVIDPFYSSAPADGGYPGLSSYYSGTQAYSSRVDIINCYISGFTVGVCISPNGSSANAENIYIHRTNFNLNKHTIAICQSQSRNVVMRDCSSFGNWVLSTTNDYGAQNGDNPAIDGLNIGATKYAFKMNLAVGPFRARGIYMESSASLGWCGLGASGGNTVASFEGCHFSFLEPTSGKKSIDFVIVCIGVAVFTGCAFTSSGGNTSKYIRRIVTSTSISAQPMAVFLGCSFSGNSDSLGGQHLLAGPGNAPYNNLFTFDNCRVVSGSSYGQQRLDNHIATNALSDLNKLLVAPGAIVMSNTDTTKMYQVAANPVTVSLGSKTITDNGDGSGAFTATDTTILQVGDIIYAQGTQVPYENAAGTTTTWWGPIGRITAIDGGTSVCTLADIPSNYAANTQNIALIYWPKFHIGTTGDTHTNTTIDNVSQAAAWQNGDRPRGTGIVAGTYISSGGGTATWTLSKATTGTSSGIRLYDADVTAFSGSAL